MPLLFPMVAALAGLATGAAPVEPASLRWSADGAVEELSLRLHGGGGAPLEIATAYDPNDGGPPPCAGDVCQPRVEVPGYQPGFRSVHRTELVLALLDRAHIEPLATLTWALVATGLRLDYTPPALDSDPGGHGGWGTVFVRLRLRLGADNVPTLPARRPARARADGA